MRHLILALVSWFLTTAALADYVPITDWSQLPEIKRSKAARYMTPQEAYALMQQEGAKTLFLDIRTRAEAMYVGMPLIADGLVPYVEHQEFWNEWDDKRTMYKLEPNPDFAAEVGRRLQMKALAKTDRIILICRSGDRSAKAADLLAAHGYTNVISIAEGFEGDLAKEGPQAGQRAVNGWKNAGLPWSYKLDKAKMYWPLR